MKKALFVVVTSIFFSFSISAQDYNVPRNYKFDNKEDYSAYEPEVKETINWILQTPLGKEESKRKDANTFLIAWLTGSPAVSVDVNTDFITFFKANAELLVIYIAGWTKYSLENNYSKDKLQGYKAGIEASVEFYKKNKSYLKKDKEIEKFEKLIEKGKLEEEIKKKLKL
ncbi:hypothetical protein GGR21_001913 [Dysgonomonas hofstadii]|uniref:Uncharacterized protein n=1 Tax=Dysgonomonas hofstadii TaxID=637886 RepID=A0A840CU32_9BACT|nr:hypothetical protein [Dysgonomonas hofstadii]MBB4036012.1 hypothetical protein [Dysgonomonas hofstadii]